MYLYFVYNPKTNIISSITIRIISNWSPAIEIIISPYNLNYFEIFN